MATPNAVAFPSTRTVSRTSFDNSSVASFSHNAHHQAAAEVCEIFYGASPPAWQAIERFYDPNATYENPFVTATSKDTLADVHALARYIAQLDVPKPGAVLCTLFRLSAEHRWREAWFRGVSMWNEVNDISECESFDGHKRTMVEHTLHILILPGLHSESHAPPTPYNSAVVPRSESTMSLLPDLGGTSSLRYRHPDLSFWPPSPFHLKLPIITRLSFNEAGKITHHRDFWDVKDLLGLIPGMTLAQWISSRLLAQGIRGVVRAGRALLRTPPSDEETGIRSESPPGPPLSKSAKSNMRSGFTIAL